MTEVGERTLEEVPISILFSQGTVVMLGTPVITGKLKLVEVLCATRQYCFLPSFLSFFLFLLSYAATDLSAYTLQHNQPRDMAPFGGSQS